MEFRHFPDRTHGDVDGRESAHAPGVGRGLERGDDLGAGAGDAVFI